MNTGVAIVAIAFSSCSSASKSPVVPFQASQWNKVKSSPPTFFPKGISAKHPTGFSDGQWIESGDSAKTSFFIPQGHPRTENLAAQARSMMTNEGRRKFKADASDIDGSGMVEGGILGFGKALLEIDKHVARTMGGVGTAGGAIRNEQTRRDEQYSN